MKMNFNLSINNEVTINNRTSPHMICSGVTGSGKTGVILLAMLKSMSAKVQDRSSPSFGDYNFSSTGEVGMCADAYIIDGKGGDLTQLPLPPDHIAITAPQAAGLLRRMVGNMHERYARYKAGFGHDLVSYEFDGKRVRPIIIVIDELAVLLNDSIAGAEIKSYLSTLLNASRMANMYVYIGIQRPSAEVITRDTTLQLGTRILLLDTVADSNTLKMLFPMVDQEMLPMSDGKRGSGLIYVEGQEYATARPIHFPNVYDLDVIRVVKKIQNEIKLDTFVNESEYWK